MAKPTAAQLQKFEADHKGLFASLVIANNLWLSMPGKYNFDPKNKTTAKYKAWMDLGNKIAQIAGKWAGRQYKLEAVKDSKVEKVMPYMGYFLQADQAKRKKLNDIALSMIKPGTAGSGLGFVPLIVWGVIALAAAFTAAYIMDEVTTTAQEQAALMKQTEATLKALDIPPDKAAAIIDATQKGATTDKGLIPSITGGGAGMLLPFALILLLISNKS